MINHKHTLVKTLVLLPVFFLITLASIAQVSPLNKRLTLNIEQVRMEDALFLISETGGFNFCYNSDLIPKDSIVNVSALEGQVGPLLVRMLGNGVDFISVGNHIVIRKKEKRIEVSDIVKEVEISGFIIDDATGNRMTEVTVFEDYQRRTYRTDSIGKFSFKLPSSIRSVALSVNYHGYFDTSLVIVPNRNMRLIIGISPKPAERKMKEASPIEIVRVRKDLTAADELILNLSSQERAIPTKKYFPAQISLLPLVGSNGIMQIGTDNYFSLNIFGGMTKGTKGLEIGGALNINRQQMHGLQIGGAANITGTDVKGMQITAGYNYAGNDAVGWQFSGVGNHVKRNMNGIQLSFGTNIVGNEARGMQISPLVNYARKIKGVQLGLINISDTIHGVAIGLLNISRSGYVRMELEGSDVLHSSFRFKSGTNYLYTILEGGVRWGNGMEAYGVGAGLGARVEYAKKRMFSEFDTDVFWIMENQAPAFDLNIVVRFSPTIGVRIAGPMEFHIGPTFNYHHSNQKNADGTYRSELGFFPFYRNERIDMDLLQQMWVGIKGGIQFNLNWKRPKKKG